MSAGREGAQVGGRAHRACVNNLDDHGASRGGTSTLAIQLASVRVLQRHSTYYSECTHPVRMRLGDPDIEGRSSASTAQYIGPAA